jgi:hypothetical protein
MTSARPRHAGSPKTWTETIALRGGIETQSFVNSDSFFLFRQCQARTAFCAGFRISLASAAAKNCTASCGKLPLLRSSCRLCDRQRRPFAPHASGRNSASRRANENIFIKSQANGINHTMLWFIVRVAISGHCCLLFWLLLRRRKLPFLPRCRSRNPTHENSICVVYIWAALTVVDRTQRERLGL